MAWQTNNGDPRILFRWEHKGIREIEIERNQASAFGLANLRDPVIVSAGQPLFRDGRNFMAEFP